MFLKSLEIRGFKSFADKTHLKFKKGVTAVVGPNGSGKSNISDSVRWVLGEQSVKTLRGGKMEDVIFAGTQFRKPVGLAQVSLTLDNSDGTLGTDYSEVTISRRIFRSGETEYLINNQKCRLKDITTLFMDTGIGKEGYSLIGQGKIDAILSGKAEERRALLEEAAGIVKFKSRKDEAEKKLSNTESNLVRIRDIISTYEERIEPLKLEKEKALKYKDFAEKLQIKEVSILVRYIKKVEEEIEAFKDSISSKRKYIFDKREALAQLQIEMKILEDGIDALEQKNLQERNEYYDNKEKASQFLNDIEIFKERISNIKNNMEESQKEVSLLEESISKEILQQQTLESELLEKRKEQKAREEDLYSFDKSIAEKIEELQKLESEMKILKDEEFDLLSKKSEINNSIMGLEKDIQAKEDQKYNFIAQIKSLEVNISINSATLKELNESRLRIESIINELKITVQQHRNQLNKLNANLRDSEVKIKDINHKISTLEGRHTLLTDLEKSYEGYNKSVQRLMERISKGIISDVSDTKVLGEIFTVDKGYETAIEISLGATISNVITRNDNVAKSLINYLKKNNMGRATFLPLNIIKGNTLVVADNVKSVEGYLGLASQIVKFDPIYKNIIEYCLGRTIITTNMDVALKVSKLCNHKVRIVTLDGEIIAPGGALTGGSIYSKGTNILSRKTEIDEVNISIEAYKAKLEKVSSEFKHLNSMVKQIDEKILDLTDEINDNSHDITRGEGEIKTMEIEANRLRNSLEISNKELSLIEDSFQKINNEIENRKNKLGNLESINSNNKARILEIDKTLQVLKSEVEGFREQAIEAKVKKAALDEIVLNKISDLKRKESELRDRRTRVDSLNNSNLERVKQTETLNLDIDERLKEISNIEVRVSELDKVFKYDEVNKVKLKQNLREMETEATEFTTVIAVNESELNKKEIQNAKCESERETHYKKLNEELNLTLAEAAEIAEEFENLNEIKDEISRLKSKITALGTVNLAAIAEYEEVSEKYEFMSHQEEDLNKAKAELIEVIQEMTTNMQVLFRENFVVLNENFGETFRELFKGGSAELILADGDELTANIEINVQPPGKKLQNINLMSGGEKVLSAIALLFAILKMKPTPFCILDEIEAALDDANVNRYAEFLKKFSRNSQFIVITHRKGTMEACDIMYGVTMEEKGISKVVSVDLSNID